MDLSENLRRLINSPAFKFILVCALILSLTVPLLFAFLLVAERANFARDARLAVGQMWGREQTIRGPYIVAPTRRVREFQTKDGVQRETVREFGVFLPEELIISGDVRSEVRHRGIFEVPVYRSTLSFQGRFVEPDTRAFHQSKVEINWREAVVVVTLDDVRGLKSSARFLINDGHEPQMFRAGIGVGGDHRAPGIHVPIAPEQAEKGFRFTFDLNLNGSSRLNFIPAGGDTVVKVSSDWPHPSFSGAFLPDQQTITGKGFSAQWSVPRLARGQGQAFRIPKVNHIMTSSAFGVDFIQPVHFYRLAERALKYALGFIGIVFLAVFVMEIQSKKRVHWIQYLFVGLALVVFYLVLIGTAEHIGFELGYLAAAVATSTLVGTYFGIVVKSRLRGACLGALVSVVYGLLYLLLRIEDYAMLIGSLAAFGLLATVMFATRNVDWSTGSVDMTGLDQDVQSPERSKPL
ncbi:MAG: cell envelope integrity protein CreD [Hyphomicrobiaceae bacterium]